MRKIDSLRAFDYSPWDEENVNLDEANWIVEVTALANEHQSDHWKYFNL